MISGIFRKLFFLFFSAVHSPLNESSTSKTVKGSNKSGCAWGFSWVFALTFFRGFHFWAFPLMFFKGSFHRCMAWAGTVLRMVQPTVCLIYIYICIYIYIYILSLEAFRAFSGYTFICTVFICCLFTFVLMSLFMFATAVC